MFSSSCCFLAVMWKPCETVSVSETFMLMSLVLRWCFNEANVNVIDVVLRCEYDPSSFIFKCDYFPSINSAGTRKQSETRMRPQQWGVMGNNTGAKMVQLARQFMS